MERKIFNGGQILLTLEENYLYEVIEGTALIYISLLKNNDELGKRYFLKEAKQGKFLIPSFKFLDENEGTWVFLITAQKKVVIEEHHSESQEAYNLAIEQFSEEISLEIQSASYFGDELLELIQRKLVAEEIFIYRTKQELEKEYEDGLQSIASIFHKEGYLSQSKAQHNLYDAVSILCKKGDINLCSYDTVVESCGKRFTIEDLARVSHFMIREIRLEPDWYKKDYGNILVYKKELDEFEIPIACVSCDDKGYVEYNVVEGTTSKITSINSMHYAKTAYMIYRPFPNKHLELRELFSYCSKGLRSKDMLSIMLLSLIIMAIGLWIPYLTQVIYDKYIYYNNTSMIYQIGMVAIAFTLGELMFDIFSRLILYKNSNRMEMMIQSAMFDRLFNLKINVYSRYETSDLIRRTLSTTDIGTIVLDEVIISSFIHCFCIVYLVRMYQYSEKLAWIGLLIILIGLIFSILISLLQTKYKKKIIEFNTNASSIMYQAIMGISKIKISSATNRILNKYIKEKVKSKELDMKYEVLATADHCIHLFLSILSTILFYKIAFMNQLNITVGELLAFISAFNLLFFSVRKLEKNFAKILQVQPLYKKANLLLAETPESMEGSRSIGNLEGKIELSNVSFRYDSNEPMVISNISLTINKGEYIGIVGSSGCGKSTLLKLLLGFESTTSGKIYYDDMDLDTLDKRELRKRLGVVLQEGQLISGSIYENVVIASSATNKEQYREEVEKVHQTIKMVGLEEDIKQMPMGLETVITEQGGTISGGQRQRILIARAIFYNPSIIFFDEATSALDNINQALIAENLDKLKSTRIVIAHRLSTVMNCDRIIVMDKGQIIESGTYDELIGLKGMFYELSMRQIA